MRILLVEDAEDKRAQLLSFLQNECADCAVSEERSLQSGLRTLLRFGADVLILDMSMPTFDITSAEAGGAHKHFAGREFLQQMDRRSIETLVIVVTQFDSFGDPPHERTLEMLDKDLQRAHSTRYLGAVYYHATQDTWKQALASLIETARQRHASPSK